VNVMEPCAMNFAGSNCYKSGSRQTAPWLPYIVKDSLMREARRALLRHRASLLFRKDG
jgi:hypothetical protein